MAWAANAVKFVRVVRRVVRVGLGERVADHLGVVDRVRRVGPQVRVGLAVLLREGEVVDVLALGQHRGADLDQLGALGVMLASASSLVGSSSLRPLTNTRSASLSTRAALGGGSKVWELVPSGTRPSIVTRSPATFATIEVIGATVVTMAQPAVVGGRVVRRSRPGGCWRSPLHESGVDTCSPPCHDHDRTVLPDFCFRRDLDRAFPGMICSGSAGVCLACPEERSSGDVA